MDRRFGIVELLFLLLALGVGIVVGLQMVQSDRVWGRLGQLDEKVTNLTNQVSRVQQQVQTLGTGVVVSPSGGGGAGGGGAGGNADQPGAQQRDTRWARPDPAAKIEWQPPVAWTTDPKGVSGYAPGGTFTEIFEGNPPKYVPFISVDVYGRRVVELVCDFLADYDPKTLQLRGVLAEAWQMDPGGMWLRVKIRDSAAFSDGKPVTAEDVRWTFHEYVMNREIDCEADRSILSASISKVDVVSDQPGARVVEFTFLQRAAFNLRDALRFYILPKHFYSQFTPQQLNQATSLLMGSGLFKQKLLDPSDQWRQGSPFSLIRNDSHWAGLRAPLDELRFIIVQIDQSRLVAYKNGDGDMMLATSEQFDRERRDPSWAAKNQSLNWVNMRTGYGFIAWQCGPRGGPGGKLTPFADKRVRQAMTYLIDRPRLLDEVSFGIGRLAHGPLAPTSPQSNKALKPYPHDLAKARELLAAAGWKDADRDGVLEDAQGRKFEFEYTLTTGNASAEKIANHVVEQCAKVGITCKLRFLDWAVYIQTLKNRDFDAITLAWQLSSPETDPLQIFHRSSIQGGGDNFVQWDNQQASDLIDAARREVDAAKRMPLWHQFEAVWHDEQPYTLLWWRPWLRFVKADVGNVQTYSKGLEAPEFFRIGGGGASPAAR